MSLRRQMIFSKKLAGSSQDFYKYIQLSTDVGLPWRDGPSLLDYNNTLSYFGGWNDENAFTPGPSTNQVVTSPDSGATYELSSSLSPASFTPRHYFGNSLLSDNSAMFWGGDFYTPLDSNQVWKLTGTTYSLITNDWGIGPIYLFGWCSDEEDNLYAIGGQNDVTLTEPIMNLNVYRSSDKGLTWPIFTTLPPGNYSTLVCYNTPSGIFCQGGGRYLPGGVSDNFNDKILLINKISGAVSQIGMLPSNMQGMYASGIRAHNKFWYLKGTNTSSVNDVGLWYGVSLTTMTRLLNPLIYGRQQEPLASHARPMALYSDTKIYGGFGNKRNDSWRIDKITCSFYLSPYLVDWYTSLSESDRPTQEPINENILLDAIGQWVDFLALSCLDNAAQSLRPLITTSGENIDNHGLAITYHGFTGNGSSQYANTKWNLFDNGLNASKNDNLMLCYLTSNSSPAQDRVIGGSLVGASESSIWPFAAGNLFYAAANQNGEAVTPTVNSIGFKGVRRQNNSSIDMIDGITITNKAFVSQDPNASDEFMGALSNTGNPQLYHNATNAMWLRTKGAVDLTVLLNALTTYFTTKGL